MRRLIIGMLVSVACVACVAWGASVPVMTDTITGRMKPDTTDGRTNFWQYLLSMHMTNGWVVSSHTGLVTKASTNAWETGSHTGLVVKTSTNGWVVTTHDGLVPTNRTLTINGVTWTMNSNGVFTVAGGGGTNTLQQVLDYGNSATNDMQAGGIRLETSDGTGYIVPSQSHYDATGSMVFGSSPSSNMNGNAAVELNSDKDNGYLNLYAGFGGLWFSLWDGTNFVSTFRVGRDVVDFYNIPATNFDASLFLGSNLTWNTFTKKIDAQAGGGSGGDWWTNGPNTAITFPTNGWSTATPYIRSDDGTNFYWAASPSSTNTPSLQQVTDAGNETTNEIKLKMTTISGEGSIGGASISHTNAENNTSVCLATGTSIGAGKPSFFLIGGGNTGLLAAQRDAALLFNGTNGFYLYVDNATHKTAILNRRVGDTYLHSFLVPLDFNDIAPINFNASQLMGSNLTWNMTTKKIDAQAGGSSGNVNATNYPSGAGKMIYSSGTNNTGYWGDAPTGGGGVTNPAGQSVTLAQTNEAAALADDEVPTTGMMGRYVEDYGYAITNIPKIRATLRMSNDVVLAANTHVYISGSDTYTNQSGFSGEDNYAFRHGDSGKLFKFDVAGTGYYIMNLQARVYSLASGKGVNCQTFIVTPPATSNLLLHTAQVDFFAPTFDNVVFLKVTETNQWVVFDVNQTDTDAGTETMLFPFMSIQKLGEL